MENPQTQKLSNRVPTKIYAGPIIGTYMDRPIYDYLIDDFGIKRIFDGIANNHKSIPPRAIFTHGQVYVVAE